MKIYPLFISLISIHCYLFPSKTPSRSEVFMQKIDTAQTYAQDQYAKAQKMYQQRIKPSITKKAQQGKNLITQSYKKVKTGVQQLWSPQKTVQSDFLKSLSPIKEPPQPPQEAIIKELNQELESQKNYLRTLSDSQAPPEIITLKLELITQIEALRNEELSTQKNQEKIDAAWQKINMLHREFNEKVNNYLSSKHVQNIKSEINNQKEIIQAHKNQVEKYENKIQKAESRKEFLTQYNKVLQEKINKLVEDAQEKDPVLYTIHMKNKEKSISEKVYETGYKDLVETLYPQSDPLYKEIENRQKNEKSLEAELNRLQKQQQTIEEELNTYRSSIKELEETLKKDKEKIQALDDAIKQVQAEISQLKSSEKKLLPNQQLAQKFSDLNEDDINQLKTSLDERIKKAPTAEELQRRKREVENNISTQKQLIKNAEQRKEGYIKFAQDKLNNSLFNNAQNMSNQEFDLIVQEAGLTSRQLHEANKQAKQRNINLNEILKQEQPKTIEEMKASLKEQEENLSSQLFIDPGTLVGALIKLWASRTTGKVKGVEMSLANTRQKIKNLEEVIIPAVDGLKFNNNQIEQAQKELAEQEQELKEITLNEAALMLKNEQNSSETLDQLVYTKKMNALNTHLEELQQEKTLAENNEISHKLSLSRNTALLKSKTLETNLESLQNKFQEKSKKLEDEKKYTQHLTYQYDTRKMDTAKPLENNFIHWNSWLREYDKAAQVTDRNNKEISRLEIQQNKDLEKINKLNEKSQEVKNLEEIVEREAFIFMSPDERKQEINQLQEQLSSTQNKEVKIQLKQKIENHLRELEFPQALTYQSKLLKQENTKE